MKKIILILIVNCTLSIVICKGQWIQTNGPTGDAASQVSCLAVKGDTIFAGTIGGVYLSYDNGASWTAVNNGLPFNASEILSIAIKGLYIFTSIIQGGVYLSSDNGIQWTLIGLNNFGVDAFAISGNNIFAGTGAGVFLSSDNGANWTAVNNGLTDTIISSLAIRGKYIFAGTYEGGIFLSTNNGTSWNLIGLQNCYDVHPVAINGENIFAGDGDGGVFFSSDNGTSWIVVNKGLPDISDDPILSFAITGNNIFAGTSQGEIFLSTNSGGNWSNVGLLTYLQVTSLVIIGDTLFAGTIDGGVWKRALSEMNGINEPVVQSLMFKVQCYPNPVNQSSIISYKLSEKGNVNISIYDLTGREVVTLIDKTQGKGEYKINFNAENLNSGVYFLKAAIKNEVRMLKFVKE